MWSSARYVLTPARALKAAGGPVVPAASGEQPVEELDRMGEVYDAFVRPFSEPIFSEALTAMRTWLRPDARVLDAGCGEGRELRAVARAAPEGEVVGVDLARGMVNAAHRAAGAKEMRPAGPAGQLARQSVPALGLDHFAVLGELGQRRTGHPAAEPGARGHVTGGQTAIGR